MAIKNVILDMGNVLLDYDPVFSVNALCKNENSREIILREFFGGSEWVETDRGTMTPNGRLEAVKSRIPEEYRDDLDAVAQGWDVCMRPLPGAKEFLAFIKEKVLGLYLLSNASTEFYSYFPRALDVSLFDGIVVSCDLKLLKPDIRIYEYLLGKYSLKAEECLFADDRGENVAGAKTAGMNAVRFTGDYGAVKELLR